MSGQMKNIDYKARREKIIKYLDTHNPYEPCSSTVDLHALVEYAKEKRIPLTELKEKDFEKFKKESVPPVKPVV